jgi:tetratricopeptide (TPR) repeat protein
MCVSLFFVACSTQPKAVKPDEKAFAQEDNYIILALHAQRFKEYKTAKKLYETLYDKSLKKEYLYRSLQSALLAKENASVVKKVDEITQGSYSDAVLVRLKIVALMEMGKLQEAKKYAIALAKYTKKANDYLLAGDVYIKNQEYDVALKYLDSAYMKNYNEKILDKMAIILYVNLHRKKDAIAYLETHSRIHGCSKRVCNRLIGIYSNENNI